MNRPLQFGHQRTRKLTSWERAKPLDADLEDRQSAEWVIQSVNSPGSPDRPRWTTLYWWVYGPCLDEFKNHPSRIGSSDSAPVFSELGIAMAVLSIINRACKGSLRSRLVMRHTTILETLIAF